MTSEPLLSSLLEEAKYRLQEIYGERLRHVLLFGSQARGEAGPKSDVDVLVVLDGPVNTYAEIKRLVKLEYKLLERFGQHVSLMPYDEAAYRDLRRPFVRNVHAEGIEL